MAGEDETHYYTGCLTVLPEIAEVNGSSIRFMDMKSYNDHHQISTKAEYKGYGGGCSGKVTKTFKSGGLIDGRNGNRVYKKEVDYDSSVKVTDKRLGITTQYETQVKHKQTTTYANPNSRSGGGKSCGKTGYAVAKPSKSSGGVQIKMAAGTRTKYTSKGSGSGGGKCEIVAKYSSSGKSSGGSKKFNCSHY